MVPWNGNCSELKHLALNGNKIAGEIAKTCFEKKKKMYYEFGDFWD